MDFVLTTSDATGSENKVQNGISLAQGKRWNRR
jgi:hypothetical protein